MGIFSEIIGTSPVADTVHPPGDGSRGGRPSFGTLDSGSLPWAMHRVPSSQPATALARGRKHIDPSPDLGGRAPVQMLMRPEVIVDRSRVHQRPVKRGSIFDRVLEEQPFYSANEPLDAAVLPGTARLAVLQANAQEVQCEAESPRRKYGFVVRPQESRTAIVTAHGDDVTPDRQRRLLRQSLYARARAAGMVHHGQHDMLATRRIRLG